MSVHGIEDRYIEKARLSMGPLEEAQHEYGVSVAIENMPNIYFFLGRRSKDLAHIVEGTDLDICFDIGHAYTNGDIDGMIDTFGDRIKNIHIHDNNGDRDSHMTIGEGSIDFVHVISRLGFYDRNLVIESKSFESAVESQSVLESLLF